jgi:superfamily I DNA/RNA helicase
MKEFDWIKERIPYNNWNQYLDPAQSPRVGRKRGLGINEREKRKEIFDLFNQYQTLLEKKNMCDWADIPTHVLRAIDNEKIKSQCYDAILVDEAQDFAPIWFLIILRMIKSKTGTLFIVGDGAQKIYRNDVTWKEIGIAANKNNTTILRKSYRSTHEILNAAIEVIRHSQTLIGELSDNGDSLIEPEKSLRHGPLPILMSFENQRNETDAISKEILKLLQQGYLPQQIAILHRHKVRHENLATTLRQHGIPAKIVAGDINFLEPTVKLCTLHSVKGMEFDVIFICGLDDFNESKIVLSNTEDMEEALEQERKLLYVGMTRARTQLYITYSGIEPAWIIQNIQEKFEKIK